MEAVGKFSRTIRTGPSQSCKPKVQHLNCNRPSQFSGNLNSFSRSTQPKVQQQLQANSAEPYAPVPAKAASQFRPVRAKSATPVASQFSTGPSQSCWPIQQNRTHWSQPKKQHQLQANPAEPYALVPAKSVAPKLQPIQWLLELIQQNHSSPSKSLAIYLPILCCKYGGTKAERLQVLRNSRNSREIVSLHYCFRGEMFKRTNLKNKGLISADRNNKATLLLTIPRSTQVVCKGFILSNICIVIQRLL